QKYPNCVLLVRVGDFYELYYEQADEIGGDVLGLQVVDKKFRSGTVRFTGFPSRSLLRYIELLVYRHGFSIALCEQFQEPMRRTFTRKVTRVITPGTLIDDQCILDTRVHSYILSIANMDRRQTQYRRRLDDDAKRRKDALDENMELSLAWLDLATGDFMTCPSSKFALNTDIARIRPKEILIDSSCSTTQALLATMYPPSQTASQPSITKLITLPDRLLLEATELSDSEQAAAYALLNYILDTQFGLLPPLHPPKRYRVDGHTRMSAPTIQALELLKPLAGDHAEAGRSLLSEIDHTRTSAGGRLLAKRLVAPSTDLDIIERRLDLVEFFGANPRTRDRIYEHLNSIGDVERAVNKLSLNCGGPHDLLDIARTLKEIAKIKALLKAHLVVPDNEAQSPKRETCAKQMARLRRSGAVQSHREQPEIAGIVRSKERALKSLASLAQNIASNIRSDASRDLRELGFLLPNSSQQIIHIHNQLEQKDNERRALQEDWKKRYGCTTLKLDTIPALGHFIEVSKRESVLMMEASEFRMIQSLKSKVRFENSQWTYLLSEIEMLRNRLQAEEMRVFEELRDSVLAASTAIRTNSKVLAEIDVAISMAMHAATRQYVRPRFVAHGAGSLGTASCHLIKNGRHPVVESQLLDANRQYIGNDCLFSSADAQVLLLTGPNMGGKSTYLRQIALISILAQVGSFVPADEAHLEIVDAIYSRIGAHDNLALDQSTFMVEMSETADILKRATAKSLVILDEIGRGTSTMDGIAIAYATLKYLHDETKCKAVFATHYHELVPHVVPNLTRIKPLQTAVYEDGRGGFAFLHKVHPGICTQSHALYVAQIAGIPKQVLKVAQD
ncbi:muts domain V-domain-containing protein, partial [Coemansia spiralis]